METAILFNSHSRQRNIWSSTRSAS